jgi:hypothetical protein
MAMTKKYCQTMAQRQMAGKDSKRLPMIAVVYISDAGSIPAASTRILECMAQLTIGSCLGHAVRAASSEISNPTVQTISTPMQKRGDSHVVKYSGGGVQVSTGCKKAVGGNGQATTQNEDVRSEAMGLKQISDGGRHANAHSQAHPIILHSANHKGQFARICPAYGCLTSS